MWTTEHTIETTVQPEAIWQQWIDVVGWKKTDPGVVESQPHGDLRVGTTGRLKPKGGPAIRFVITSCEPLRSFIKMTAGGSRPGQAGLENTGQNYQQPQNKKRQKTRKATLHMRVLFHCSDDSVLQFEFIPLNQIVSSIQIYWSLSQENHARRAWFTDVLIIYEKYNFLYT